MYNNLLHRPRNSGRFEALMDLYEKNYMLMRLLAPQLKNMHGGCFVSRGHSPLPLELRDIQHTKYTTTFTLTYRFSRALAGRRCHEPNLCIRLYHDARTCEVMSGLMPDQRSEPRRTRDLDEGQRLNRFLFKWLDYCLRQGHGFSEQPVRYHSMEYYSTQCVS